MKILYSDNLKLIDGKKVTYISSDLDKGSASGTVESIIGLAIDQVLLIGEFGNEQSEIIKTHASTTPTGSTVTFASNTVFDHEPGTKVYILNYDRLEISHSATETGSKSVLSTINLQADQLETQYTDTTKTSGYYFIRWNNSITSDYSDYPDAIPYGGLGEDEVGNVIDYALRRNKTSFTDNVTHGFCIDEINSCLRYIRGKRKKWSRLQQFDYVLGQTSRGIYNFSLPSDIWDYSNKSILAIHFGTGSDLLYVDEREWNEKLEGVVHDTMASDASAGATTLTVSNGYDLPTSGSIMVIGQVITYTSIDRDTGILSGVPASGDGAITATLTEGDDVWQGGYEEGAPEVFTIKEAKLYFWPLVNATNINKNAWVDYWMEVSTVDSDSDTLASSRFDMIKYWLVWIIRAQLKNDGMRDFNDGDFRLFREILNDAIKIEANTTCQKFKTKPRLNRIIY